MKENVLVPILCLLWLCSCNNTEKYSEQDTIQDSIRYYINKSFDFKHTDQEIAFTAAKAYELIKQTKIDSLYIVNSFFVSYAYDNIGEKELFRDINYQMVEIAKKRNDSINLARAYNHIGESYKRGINIDSAFYYYSRALKIYQKKKNNLEVGKLNLRIAKEKYFYRDYFGSEKSAVIAFGYLRLEENIQPIFETNTLLGLNCVMTKDYFKAQDYFLKAYNQITSNTEQKFTELQLKAVAINNLAYINIQLNNFEKAMTFIEEGLNEPNLKVEHPELYATFFFNRGIVNFKTKNYSRVTSDLHQSLRVRKELKLFFRIAECEMALADYFNVINEKDSALSYAQSAYKKAKDSGILSLHLDAVDALVKIDKANFVKHSKERIQLSDSLLNTERKIAEKFARIEFETDEIILEKEKAEQEREQMLLILVLVLFSGGLLLIILWQRNKQKQLILINSQQKASEEIYQLMLDQQIKFDEGREKEKKRISRELHDGVMNKLAGIRYNLFKLEKKQDTETIQNCLQHIAELHTVEKELRDIAHDLNFDVFSNKNDYATLLNTLIKDNEDEYLYIDLEVTESIQWESIPSLVKMNCYRIIQEALTNIKKHAKASKVNINFTSQPNQLSIILIDNGIGFNPNKIKLGLGLKNIKERAETLEAIIKIQSKVQQGTKIEIKIPI